MSELARQLFDGIKGVKEAVQAIAPGLSAEKIVGDVMAEGKRQVMQSAGELSHALFNGSAYLPYGVGQQPAGKEGGVHGVEVQKDHVNEGHGR